MMKKLIIVLFAVLPFSLIAQKGAYFGVTGGVNNTWVINQQDFNNPFILSYDYLPTIGSSFGVLGGYQVSDNFGVQLEIRYTSLGQDYEREDGNLISKRELSLNYLQFPVLVRFNGGNHGDRARFYTLLGPTFGVLSRANDKINQPLYNDNINRRDDINGVDINGTIEFGADVSLVSGLYLNFGLRFNISITDIIDENYHNQNNYKASRNAYGGLNVGLSYKLGH